MWVRGQETTDLADQVTDSGTTPTATPRPTRTPEPSTSPEPSATPDPSATPGGGDGPVVVGSNPAPGSGQWEYAGAGPTLGYAGQVWTYRVAVEVGLPVSLAEFTALVDATLGDPRGWAGRGERRFQRVAGSASFTVYLASPWTAYNLCRSVVDIRIGGVPYTNCQAGAPVVINSDRYLHGASASPAASTRTGGTRSTTRSGTASASSTSTAPGRAAWPQSCSSRPSACRAASPTPGRTRTSRPHQSRRRPIPHRVSRPSPRRRPTRPRAVPTRLPTPATRSPDPSPPANPPPARHRRHRLPTRRSLDTGDTACPPAARSTPATPPANAAARSTPATPPANAAARSTPATPPANPPLFSPRRRERRRLPHRRVGFNPPRVPPAARPSRKVRLGPGPPASETTGRSTSA